MNSTIHAFSIKAPPRRVAVVTPIANPATVPAVLPSSRMAARDRAQSWRGKYLRALNICPADIENVRRQAAEKAITAPNKLHLRPLNFHRSDYADHHALSRSYSSSTEKEDEERKSRERSSQQQQQQYYKHDQASHRRDRRDLPQQHQIHAVPLRAPSTSTIPIQQTAENPYGFPTRAGIARNRRCHTDPFLLDERVSAPIQIPSASSGTHHQLDNNLRHRNYASNGHTRRRASPQSIQINTDDAVVPNTNHNSHVRLLSWEEPVAMLAAADAVSKGWRMPMASMELGVRRGRDNEVPEVCMDDEDDEDEFDPHGGDIFAMDESEEVASQNNQHLIARRCDRTESMTVVSSGREKRNPHGYDHFDGIDQPTDLLSQSFVPPHQLVDRSSLFSIGLRDEFKKRRPINHI